MDNNALPENQKRAFQHILGAPFVPAVILLIALCWCMESPRYYMQPGTPHRNPSRAYEILLRARQTQVSENGLAVGYSVISLDADLLQLQALRDLYLLHKSVELDTYSVEKASPEVDIEIRGISVTNSPRNVETEARITSGCEAHHAKDGLTYANNLKTGISHSYNQYRNVFGKLKLRNALMSTCVVALAQQLCGSKSTSLTPDKRFSPIQKVAKLLILVNVFAFYSSKFDRLFYQLLGCHL